MTGEAILRELDNLFPNARCELSHRNNYEMAVAVILSAQTTDASVNRVTPALFGAYPTVFDLAKAPVEEIERAIATLGLYHNKAKAIQGFAQGVAERFDGQVPEAMEDLTSLPGVGRKCANVIRSECFAIPSFAVDTHVSRIAKRLRIADEKDSVLTIEKKLMRKFPKNSWISAHHHMIFFGRYLCHARRPECWRCPFVAICREKEMIKASHFAHPKTPA